MLTFVLYDALHAEIHGEFASIGALVAEVERRATISWDKEPNRPPCESWQTCGRRYQSIEYDGEVEVRRLDILEVSKGRVNWIEGDRYVVQEAGQHQPPN